MNNDNELNQWTQAVGLLTYCHDIDEALHKHYCKKRTILCERTVSVVSPLVLELRWICSPPVVCIPPDTVSRREW